MTLEENQVKPAGYNLLYQNCLSGVPGGLCKTQESQTVPASEGS